MGDDATATALRERAAAMAPSPQLHRRLAEECERRGDEAAARHHRARAHFHLGKAAYRRNRLEDALREFREAAVHDDRHVATWYRAGEMAYHLGRRAEAVEAFRRVADLEPDHERALRWLDLLATAAVSGPDGG
jgi:tetratricopeptide (TPR) repeat protein